MVFRLPRVALLLCAEACAGSITGSGGDDPERGDDVPSPAVSDGPGPARIWVLTPKQYQATVEQALGARVNLSNIELTARHESFLNPAVGGLEVGDVFFANLEEAVNRIAADQAPNLAGRLGCALPSLDRPCLRPFVETFGRKIFRVPHWDFAPYLDLFDTLAPKAGAASAFESVLAAILLSPKALFRVELGEPVAGARHVRLSAAELAESLALTLWDGPPDEELLQLAGSRKLSEPTVFSHQVDRMLAAPRGGEGLHQMLAEWLGVATFVGAEKNPVTFPMFTPALKQAMLDEARRFVDLVLTTRGASLIDLLTWQETSVDARLAADVYRLPPGAVTDGRAPFPPERRDERAGAFTLPGAVAAMSEPTLTGVVYRGKVLLEKLVCKEVAPPDMDVDFPRREDVGLPKDATTRQLLETVEKDHACAGCHLFLHPMSFAMENYDAIGRYRARENGRTIDGSGQLAFTRTASAPYRNAVEMFRIVAASEEGQECFTRQTFRYVYGREEGERDKPLVARAHGKLKAGGLDVRNLYRALVLDDAFALRERRHAP